MRQARVWARLLGVAGAIVESVDFDGDDLVVKVRLSRRQRRRCGQCGKPAPRYDAGGGQRRWRALDLGSTLCYLEAEAPRVNCPEHGPTVIQVPWADHDTRSSRSFDDQVAWLAVHSDATAASELMRISWRRVGWIVARVSRRLRRGKDALHGLRRIDKHFEAILNSLVHDLSNARIESLNTRIRLLTRRAFGFHSAAPLIGSFGRLQLALPGRA